MNNNKRIPFLLTLALLVAGYFSISPAAKAADASAGGSEQVSKLFSDVKAEAHQLERDAEDLHGYARSSLSWESHTAKLDMIREHVNKTGRLLTELNDARDTAAPWQQKAIDEINPLLKELADNTEATINHLNDNKGHLNVGPEFGEFVTANYDLAKELTALITDYVDYGKHEAEFQRLQGKLQVAER
ncbi:MAG TPA: hypothetical protein VMT20_24550 [Terriglobia bacterium]|nr:hypothetical protein [Terriglobia bacterium]